MNDRLSALSGLAAECGRFVREQEAIAQARIVVRDADRVLGAAALPALGHLTDVGDDLSERTRAVLSAYRDLTREQGVDGV